MGMIRLSQEIKIKGLQAVTETLPQDLQELVRNELLDDPDFRDLLDLLEQQSDEHPVNTTYARTLVRIWKNLARRINDG